MRNDKKSEDDAAAIDAISLLTIDHKKVRQLFDEYEEIKDEEEQEDLKSELVEQICFEISMHALVEEEIFYPAVRAAIDDDDLMDEAEAEHASAKDLISQLEEMEADDEQFDATVAVLAEQIAQHISSEEDDMFARVKKSNIDISALGQQIKERKEEIEGDFKSAPASVRVPRTGERKPDNPS